jgi:hypothetical protein
MRHATFSVSLRGRWRTMLDDLILDAAFWLSTDASEPRLARATARTHR